MSTQTLNIHHPLPHATEYLRILTVHSGDVLEPIRCTLRTVSFHGKPTYDALSYTWGDPDATKPIEVDGTYIQVTSNLEQALRHMRHVNTDLVLWIDAICINQLDVTEKSHQVALMGKIYSECAQVRIWLGCDTTQCRLARVSCSVGENANGKSEAVDPFGLMRMMATGLHIHEWSCFQAEDVNKPGKFLYHANDNFNMMWEGLLAVDRSPWWTRIWTVQEAILPRTGVVYLDTWNTSLQTITECGQCYRNYAWEICCQDAISSLPSEARNVLEQFCSVAENLHADRKRDEEGKLELDSFRQQNAAYGFRECEDPRDKVYGLLGIISEHILTPDYSKSKDEVFFRATFRMLGNPRYSLQSLIGPQYGPAPGKWASWVRDFDAPLNRTQANIAWDKHMLINHRHAYDASGSDHLTSVLLRASPPPTGEVIERVGIRVLGRRVRKVTFVSGDTTTYVLEDDLDVGRNVFRKWMLQALCWTAVDISAHLDTHSDAHVHTSRVLGFWRTLLGGLDFPVDTEGLPMRFGKFTRATMWCFDRFLSWLENETRRLNGGLVRLITVATNGRCYFEAENDGQGLCYPKVRADDEIWVLDGGTVPFILRPAHLNKEEREALKPVDEGEFWDDEIDGSVGDHQSDKPIEAYYQFIGDCYFDGYMHGEAVRDSTLHKQSIVLV